MQKHLYTVLTAQQMQEKFGEAIQDQVNSLKFEANLVDLYRNTYTVKAIYDGGWVVKRNQY